MNKQFFEVDLVQNSKDVFTAICEKNNDNNISDVITGISIIPCIKNSGIKCTSIRRTSEENVVSWLKSLTSEEITKYKDTIIDTKYGYGMKRTKPNIRSRQISYR